MPHPPTGILLGGVAGCPPPAAIAEQLHAQHDWVQAGPFPGGYRWRQWDHLKEERRRAEIETQGRASVADLYE